MKLEKLTRLLSLAFLAMVAKVAMAATPFVQHIKVPECLTSEFVSIKPLSSGDYIAVGNGDSSSTNLILVYKFNAGGDILWTKRINPVTPSKPHWAVKADVKSDGSIYILAAEADFETQYNKVMHLNSSGQVQWQTRITDNGQWAGARCVGIRTAPDGSCVVVGSTPYFASAPFMVKVSSSGSIIWSKDNFTYDPSGWSSFYALDIDNSGNIYATGRIHNNISSSEKFYLVKVTSSGSLSWEKVLYSGLPNIGDSTRAVGQCVVVTNDNNGCIVGGEISDKGNPSAGPSLLKKFDNAGNEVWTKKYYRWQPPQDYPSQKGIVYNLYRSGTGYIAFIHQYWGSTSPGALVVRLNENGDTLWSQYGYDYRWRVMGIDNYQDILMGSNTPHPDASYWGHAIFVKASNDGLYAAPECQLPYNGNSNVERKPMFSWRNTVHKASSYTLQVARDSSFSNIVHTVTGILDDTLWWPWFILNAQTKYYWRVRTVGAENGYSKWSNYFYFTTGVAVGVKDVADASANVQLFPNPFWEKIAVSFELDKATVADVTIYDVTGKVVYEQKGIETYVGSNTIQLHPENLTKGVYFLSLKSGKIDIKRAVVKD